jgi:hypothetical protein
VGQIKLTSISAGLTHVETFDYQISLRKIDGKGGEGMDGKDFNVQLGQTDQLVGDPLEELRVALDFFTLL